MPDYLLEIGTEEIPAKFMPDALSQLQELAAGKLAGKRIKYERISVYGTPRRLALLIEGLAEKGEDSAEKVRGPAKKAAFGSDGKATQAAQGFARSQGVTVDELLVQESGNGEYVFAVKKIKGQPVREFLPEMAKELIVSLSFPKPMRWSDKEIRFARPIRWLVSLLDQEVIAFELDGLLAGRTTRGHRFLGKESVILSSPPAYKEQLLKEFVMVDPEERKSQCRRQIEEIAREAGVVVQPDEELLTEVTYLLEWPTALMGEFEEEYLDMPAEVIITPMREHQRYFPVRDKDGRLLNRFVTVRNGTDDNLAVVREGNERVLKARLADARFFWEEDRKRKLEEYLPRLEKVVFQENLGTLAAKTERIVALVKYLGGALGLPEAIRRDAERAAQLAKADLVTAMVYEFPELQGVMGSYYARLSGESEGVAQAILEHYQPRFAGDAIPAILAGALVSMADKMDAVAGCFAIGIEPTGSQDPYALRRQAMGVCQIILGHNLEIRLDELTRLALSLYRGILPEEKLDHPVENKIREFFKARLRNILSDEGHRYDVVETVLGDDYDLLPITSVRAETLSMLKDREEFRELVVSFTRAYNLSKKALPSPIEPGSFIDPAEKELYAALEKAESKVGACAVKRDFSGAVKELAGLSEPINRFFDAVMVMAEDEKVRQNRLGLLLRYVELTKHLGDLSKLVM